MMPLCHIQRNSVKAGFKYSDNVRYRHCITVGLTFKTQYASTDNPDDVAATNGTKFYLMAGQD